MAPCPSGWPDHQDEGASCCASSPKGNHLGYEAAWDSGHWASPAAGGKALSLRFPALNPSPLPLPYPKGGNGLIPPVRACFLRKTRGVLGELPPSPAQSLKGAFRQSRSFGDPPFDPGLNDVVFCVWVDPGNALGDSDIPVQHRRGEVSRAVQSGQFTLIDDEADAGPSPTRANLLIREPNPFLFFRVQRTKRGIARMVAWTVDHDFIPHCRGWDRPAPFLVKQLYRAGFQAGRFPGQGSISRWYRLRRLHEHPAGSC